MLRSLCLSLSLAFGVATGANAAFVPHSVGTFDSPVVKVGEGCGRGMWRGPRGGCNRFYGPGGNRRGTPYECPRGFHIGPGGARCWPNR